MNSEEDQIEQHTSELEIRSDLNVKIISFSKEDLKLGNNSLEYRVKHRVP
jgi:hypothetical protein